MLSKAHFAGWLLILLALSLLPVACLAPPEPITLTVYGWEDELTADLFTDFTAATGIRVEPVIYTSTEEGVESLRAGNAYDVMVTENRFVPTLIAEGLLAPIDQSHIPNFRNISLNFRDLLYDPGNHYTVPYSWGTTGLLVRTDLVEEPVRRWADLWDGRYAGRVAIWRGQSREVISLTLKSLGYSANEESPEALAAAEARLLDLRPHVLFIEDYSLVSAASMLADGTAVMAMGYSRDMIEGRQLNPNIEYLLPEEGAVLWGDNFVIPAASQHPKEAADLINYLLSGLVGASLIQRTFYALPNEAALALLGPALAGDPVLFPPQEVMQNTEIVMPLSPEGEERYARVWQNFLDGGE